MTKKNFTDRLMEHSVSFALTFLVITGMAIALVIFGIVVFVAYWWNRIH